MEGYVVGIGDRERRGMGGYRAGDDGDAGIGTWDWYGWYVSVETSTIAFKGGGNRVKNDAYLDWATETQTLSHLLPFNDRQWKPLIPFVSDEPPIKKAWQSYFMCVCEEMSGVQSGSTFRSNEVRKKESNKVSGGKKKGERPFLFLAFHLSAY